MAEEKIQPAEISNDDVSALNVLLHNIQGISPVSTPELVAATDEE